MPFPWEEVSKAISYRWFPFPTKGKQISATCPGDDVILLNAHLLHLLLLHTTGIVEDQIQVNILSQPFLMVQEHQKLKFRRIQNSKNKCIFKNPMIAVFLISFQFSLHQQMASLKVDDRTQIIQLHR